MLEKLLKLLQLCHRGASAECRRKGLEVLNRIFTNITEHPSESKYKRINMTSAMWSCYISPAFYLFRLIEWMKTLGFEQDNENSFLYFKADELGEIIMARDEVRILLEACVNSFSLEKEDTNSDNQKQILPLLRSLVGPFSEKTLGDNGDAFQAKTKVVTQPHLLRSTWEDVKIYLRLVVLWRECVKQGYGHGPGLDAVVQPHLPPERSAVWESLVKSVTVLDLAQLDEDFAVVEAEWPKTHEDSMNSFLDANDPLDQNVRRRVAEKHKNSLLSEDRGSSGVHAEVKFVATRLIADIASCIEQIAFLEGKDGMVREDRLEARNLLSKFNEDGDILYLHSLKAEWMERLEATKKKHGKCFVYL